MVTTADDSPTSGAGDDVTALLANELRKVYRSSGRSLRELEQITYTSDSALSRYISGQALPPWPVVEALCHLGECDPTTLRPLWQRARQARSNRRVAPAGKRTASDDAAGGPDNCPESAGSTGPTVTAADPSPDAVADSELVRVDAASPGNFLAPVVPRRPSWGRANMAIVVTAAVTIAGILATFTWKAFEDGAGADATRAAPRAANVVCATGYRVAGDGRCEEAPFPTPPAGGGEVHEIYNDASGWHDVGTGLRAQMIAAVDMGATHPDIMLISNGVLSHAHWSGTSNWHVENTGIRATAVSAVNAGGGTPYVVTIGNGGTVHEVRVVDGRWRETDTGIPAAQISTTTDGRGGAPFVIAADANGRVLSVRLDAAGWRADDTGLQAKSIAAVYMRGSQPQIMAANAEQHLLQCYADETGWHLGDTLQLATVISAINMGGFWPDVLSVAMNGDLVHIYGDKSGWHTTTIGIRVFAVSAINLNRSLPYVIAIR